MLKSHILKGLFVLFAFVQLCFGQPSSPCYDVLKDMVKNINFSVQDQFKSTEYGDYLKDMTYYYWGKEIDSRADKASLNITAVVEGVPFTSNNNFSHEKYHEFQQVINSTYLNYGHWNNSVVHDHVEPSVDALKAVINGLSVCQKNENEGGVYAWYGYNENQDTVNLYVIWKSTVVTRASKTKVKIDLWSPENMENTKAGDRLSKGSILEADHVYTVKMKRKTKGDIPSTFYLLPARIEIHTTAYSDKNIPVEIPAYYHHDAQFVPCKKDEDGTDYLIHHKWDERASPHTNTIITDYQCFTRGTSFLSMLSEPRLTGERCGHVRWELQGDRIEFQVACPTVFDDNYFHTVFGQARCPSLEAQSANSCNCDFHLEATIAYQVKRPVCTSKCLCPDNHYTSGEVITNYLNLESKTHLTPASMMMNNVK